jgi:hypothetical protein
VVAATGSYAQNRDVVASDNASTATAGIVVDGDAVIAFGDHQFTGRLHSEQRGLLINPGFGDRMPLLKTRDRVDANVMYDYAVGGAVGPFLRTSARGRAARTWVSPRESIQVEKTFLDGRTTLESVSAGETFRVSRGLAPLRLEEAAGVTIRARDTETLTLKLLGGMALRQYFFRSTFVRDDQESTAQIEYRELDNFDQVGAIAEAEGTLRLSDRALLRSRFEIFLDKDDRHKPAYDWQTSIDLAITDLASLRYSVEIERVPQIIDRLQISQSLAFRIGFSIL